MCSHGQVVKTLASHAGIRGSTPLGTTNKDMQFQQKFAYPFSLLKTLKFHNVVNLTKRAVRNDFSSSPETIVQRSWHCDFGKTKIRKPISLLSASAFCCFGHSLPVGSLNSCAYECWNIWREADSCFVHSACLA